MEPFVFGGRATLQRRGRITLNFCLPERGLAPVAIAKRWYHRFGKARLGR